MEKITTQGTKKTPIFVWVGRFFLSLGILIFGFISFTYNTLPDNYNPTGASQGLAMWGFLFSLIMIITLFMYILGLLQFGYSRFFGKNSYKTLYEIVSIISFMIILPISLSLFNK